MSPSEAAASARSWLIGAALPLWAECGVDPSGLYAEQLDYAGRADLAASRRVRVQARQLYVFLHARRMGWFPSEGVERSFEAFVACCWSPGGRPGWVHRLDASGAVIDAQRDLYDQAFCLFALAAAHRTLGDPRALSLAEETLAMIDRDFAHPQGGFLESLPPALPRRQNPHMHLLEAMLAWHAATGERTFLERADAILGLFEARFYDRASRTLGEFFTDDWRPADGEAGQLVEPGHHFEWVWLLRQAADAGARDLSDAARALYAFGAGYGLDGQDLAVDECDRAGRQLRRSRRAWPQTELIKAQLAMGDREAAARTWAAVRGGYLATQVPGLWIDQFDAEGAPVTETVPASTFYHLMVAIDQLLAAAG